MIKSYFIYNFEILLKENLPKSKKGCKFGESKIATSPSSDTLLGSNFSMLQSFFRNYDSDSV